MLVSLQDAKKEGLSCPCVGKHVPLPTQYHRHHIVPKYLGGGDDPDNFLVLCPTTHYNIHSLLQHYAKQGGRPPGKIRKHYSDFVQELAQRAWDNRQVRRSVGDEDATTEIVDPWWEEQVQ